MYGFSMCRSHGELVQVGLKVGTGVVECQCMDGGSYAWRRVPRLNMNLFQAVAPPPLSEVRTSQSQYMMTSGVH